MENEIKAKVFAQYLGQLIQYPSYLGDKEVLNELTLCSVSTKDYENKCRFSGHYKDGLQIHFDFDDSEDVKLILKPLSDITDEDAIEVAEMLEIYGMPVGHCEYLNVGIKFIDGHADKINRIPVGIYQYLQSKGYDLPHYLLGGKTLKEAGLAIYK